MDNKRIILASSSPRRRKILTEMGLDFEVIPSDYDENIEDKIFTYEKIETIAYNKAKSVLDKTASGKVLILSADTVVVLDGEILGKPLDETDAINMLKKLSGRKHSVVTGICVIDSENFKKEITSFTSYVEFHQLSEELITDYIKIFKPLDKAGSYGIQELPAGFVKSIEGSFENIIGLCPLAVKEVISRFTE